MLEYVDSRHSNTTTVVRPMLLLLQVTSDCTSRSTFKGGNGVTRLGRDRPEVAGSDVSGSDGEKKAGVKYTAPASYVGKVVSGGWL
jgi:hypothetical protein